MSSFIRTQNGQFERFLKDYKATVKNLLNLLLFIALWTKT
ncbi:hypothetical protein TPE_1418 [Treponema pedis str. T A4]|uniref:Uncharacterized protein n=1 Tax=Treponema pedis str. T A4 TaxID=1291379 RepID=S5ZZW5_9SPIR|nr:hypothetical protein TPE_1418 [Treponema pedis str. T A4]